MRGPWRVCYGGVHIGIGSPPLSNAWAWAGRGCSVSWGKHPQHRGLLQPRPLPGVYSKLHLTLECFYSARPYYSAQLTMRRHSCGQVQLLKAWLHLVQQKMDQQKMRDYWLGSAIVFMKGGKPGHSDFVTAGRRYDHAACKSGCWPLARRLRLHCRDFNSHQG